MDAVVGKKKATARLLVLPERVTRREIIIRIKDGRTETVVQALDRLERIYSAAFYTVFKSITVDNGSEFADADVASVEDWINNYPREILGFQSSAQMFSAAFAAAA